MTPLSSIAERAGKASPGPWKGDRYDGTVKYDVKNAEGGIVIHGDNEEYGLMGSWYDAAFVVHSRADIPYLLDLIAKKDEALLYIEFCKDTSVLSNCEECKKMAKKALSLGHEETK